MHVVVSAVTLLASLHAAFGADLKGNPIAGRETAKKYCAECHDTTGNAKPRNPPGNAPPFIALAQSNRTPEELRQYVALPHGRMINLMVTGDEADDVASYIVSLRHK